ncbi:MAG: metallophosphoesterase [Pseudomonadota bacterium]|nr:metallophosphoesterase [Pseudomonadota bacterium]
MPRSRRRFVHPAWLVTALPAYIGLRLLPDLGFGTLGFAIGIAVLLTACVLIPLSVGRHSRNDRNYALVMAWVGFFSIGLFSSLFIATLLRDVFLLGARVVSTAHQAAALATPSARWVLMLTLFSSVVGLVIARRPRLVEVDIPIADLPKPLQGFSIAQISDLHVGPTIKRAFVQRIVARVNVLKADLIAITGDLVDGSVSDLSQHTAPLAGLEARHGVYFVTGNHEYYSGERAWTAELRRLGLTVLKNEHVVLQHDGAPLLLAGVTDFSAHHFDPAQRSDPAAALLGSVAGASPKILLAHQPSTAIAAEAAGYDVQISGHTHGGQFWPWNLLVGYFQPFTAGLNRLKKLTVYVSRGTGYWGPPNRFGVPAEITRLRLVSA